MNLTPNQAAAAMHRGSNLLVSASAGSGKTEVLARRCISLISDDGCDVDQLLVVTFTRAAAAELRVRIANKLHDLVASPDQPRRLRDHLRRQAVLVDSVITSAATSMDVNSPNNTPTNRKLRIMIPSPFVYVSLTYDPRNGASTHSFKHSGID